MKKILSPVLIIAFLILAFGAGFYYGQHSLPSIEKVSGIQNLEQGKSQAVDFSLFWDAWNEIQQKFVNRTGLDYQKMVYGAISGMLASLGDPYTVFLNPQENKDFSQSLQGNLEGIGAEVGMRNNILTIISPLEDSPAQRAGFKPGDKILKINDELTAGMTVEEAVSKIRGPKGTEVRLTIARDAILLDVVPESGQLRPNVENIIYIMASYPDGSPAQACGNGMRCVVQALAAETGRKDFLFETVAGILDHGLPAPATARTEKPLTEDYTCAPR